MNQKFYYPELDGLRFLAFLLVYIHHAPVFTSLHIHRVLYDYGWVGVDLFLCLSAFLFTKLLFMEHNTTGDINVKNFYVRRALRIWPLYYAFFACSLFFTLYALDWEIKTRMAWRIAGMAFFLDNIFSAYWKYNKFLYSAHLWTISYEEQFYAIIPWTLRKMFKVSNRAKVIALLSVFVFFSLVRAAMIYIRAPHPAIWTLPITHFESILGGLAIGLGLFDKRANKISPWIWATAGIACLAMVSMLPNATVNSWYLMLTYPLVGLGTSLILLSLSTERDWLAKSVARRPWLSYLGKISYGLYVFHAFGIVYAEKLINRLEVVPQPGNFSFFLINVAGLIITIATASLSYHLLEKPFLRYKERFSAIQSRPV